MLTFLYTLLVVSGLLLIVMVLLQAGKGAGAGLSIGGGMSQTMFGGSGGRGFFIKLTAVLAAVFMILCLVLAKISSKGAGQYKGVMAGTSAPMVPASPSEPAAAAAPVAPAAQPQPNKADIPLPAKK